VNLEGLLLSPLTWVGVGLLLLLIDIFLLNMVLVPFSIASGIVAVLAFSDQSGVLGGFTFFDSWRDVALAYSLLVVAGYLLLRRAIGRWSRGSRDINEY
jgi:membrane protein implicated in regulation of membrane protease activity